MVSDPIDVSMSAEELKVATAKREAEEAAAAAERNVELAALAEAGPIMGNPDAPVTIVEFSDFQCPYCSRAANTVEQILAKYPNDVRFVYKHFPLGFHPWAKPAAIASECAAAQNDDAFWSLHDKFFENQKALNPGNVIAKSKEYLAGSGIDMEKWATCAENQESEEYKAASAAVDAAMETGKKHGVSGTPGFFVNGRFLNGAQPLAAFEPLIEAAKNNADS
jgi:protein-disulfide isomerase